MVKEEVHIPHVRDEARRQTCYEASTERYPTCGGVGIDADAHICWNSAIAYASYPRLRSNLTSHNVSPSQNHRPQLCFGRRFGAQYIAQLQVCCAAYRAHFGPEAIRQWLVVMRCSKTGKTGKTGVCNHEIPIQANGRASPCGNRGEMTVSWETLQPYDSRTYGAADEIPGAHV